MPAQLCQRLAADVDRHVERARLAPEPRPGLSERLAREGRHPMQRFLRAVAAREAMREVLADAADLGRML